MTRHVAFLRAINVGGHTVSMARLKQLFEALGLAQVSTFIASGNVLFSADESDGAALEERIEAHLRAELGYSVETFVRAAAELRQVAAYEPFAGAEPRDGDSHFILFLKRVPDEEPRRQVLALANDADLLHLHARELYWLRRGSILDATIKSSALDKLLGPTTSRNLNTVRRIVARLEPGG